MWLLCLCRGGCICFLLKWSSKDHRKALLWYTDSWAELATTNEVHDAIDSGDIDKDAMRWWSAITSFNPGWKAIIGHDGKNVLISLWLAAMNGEQKLKIRRENNTNTAVPSSTPPSSKQASQFLIDFCAFYEILCIMCVLCHPNLAPRKPAVPIGSKYRDIPTQCHKVW